MKMVRVSKAEGYHMRDKTKDIVTDLVAMFGIFLLIVLLPVLLLMALPYLLIFVVVFLLVYLILGAPLCFLVDQIFAQTSVHDTAMNVVLGISALITVGVTVYAWDRFNEDMKAQKNGTSPARPTRTRSV